MSGWRAVNTLFLVSTILEGLANGHLTAFSPLFLAELGQDPEGVRWWTGILYGVMMALAFPLAPFWGPVAERYSRRMVIVRSMYLETIAYAINALAPSVWWLLVARLILGFTFGNVAVVIATQALLTPRRHVGTAIATIQIASPIAASIGPPFGAVLIDVLGLRGLFWLDAGIALTAALLVTFLMPEPPKRDTQASVLSLTREVAASVWRRSALRWNFAAWFLGQGGRVVVEAYLPVRIAELTSNPASAIGLILGVYGVITTASVWLVGKLVDDEGGIKWFGPAMIVGVVATLGIALAPTIPIVAVLAWLRSIPFAAHQTLLYGHLARTLSREEQTPIMAFSTVPRNVAGFVFPLIAAAVAPFGAGAALSTGAVAYGANVVVGWLLLRATRREAAAESETARTV